MINYGISGLILMEENKEYVCNYPFDPDVSHIETSHKLCVEQQYTGSLGSLKEYVDENTFIFNLPTHHYYNKKDIGDIIDSIIIQNCIVTEIILNVSYNEIFHKKITSLDNSIKIRPFKWGIPVISLCMSESYLIIKANKIPEVIVDYIYLSNDDRKYIAKNPLYFENTLISDGILHIGKFSHKSPEEMNEITNQRYLSKSCEWGTWFN